MFLELKGGIDLVRLKNIERHENRVTCDAYLESCKVPVKLVYDIKKREFEEFEYPKGFEYCTQHIFMAKWFIEDTLKAKSEFPASETIMWY